jgi:hypothetical protein
VTTDPSGDPGLRSPLLRSDVGTAHQATVGDVDATGAHTVQHRPPCSSSSRTRPR